MDGGLSEDHDGGKDRVSGEGKIDRNEKEMRIGAQVKKY